MAAAGDPGHHRLRHTGRKRGGDSRVDRGPALGEDLQAGVRRGRMTCRNPWGNGHFASLRRLTLTKEAKQEIVGRHGHTDSDTGSPEVQIALLTRRIDG